MGQYDITKHEQGAMYVLRLELSQVQTRIKRNFPWIPIRLDFQRGVPCMWVLEKRQVVNGEVPTNVISGALLGGWIHPNDELNLFLLETGEAFPYTQDADLVYLGSLFEANPPLGNPPTGYKYILHAFVEV